MEVLPLLAALVLAPGTGPDAIIADIPGTHFWARDDVESAYSTSILSCNVGDEPLLWEGSPSTDHPVRGANLFRLSVDGRFEQIGQSWLHPGFCALRQSEEACGTCESAGGCHFTLPPGCATPNTASRNGSQSGLRPKWQVNPHTGEFPFPWANGEGTGGDFRRRLRVDNVDLDPARNAGARYFFERQIISRDDAAAGNQNNGATYREATYRPETSAFTMSGAARPGSAAIAAWRDVGAGVTLVDVQVDDDGLFMVGYAVTEGPDGTWRYEYAVQNLNAHRAARAFTVPVPDDVELAEIGFHDVHYHSGDGIDGVNFDGTDWSITRDASGLTWATETIEENANANALRWGTVYNFRFTANAPPRRASGRLDLFRPGDPAFMAVAIDAPRSATCPADVDGSGAVDFNDLLAVLAAWGACDGCPEDLDRSGTVDFDDVLIVLATWGACAEGNRGPSFDPRSRYAPPFHPSPNNRSNAST